MNVIIVTGSARPNSAGNNVAPLVMEALAAKATTTAKLIQSAELNLPFYNAPSSPSAEDFTPTDENVIAWTEIVRDADAVVLLTPEYNGGPSGIQKNAIDWVYKEWHDKPVVMIGYGWYEPSRVHESLKLALDIVKAKQGEHVQLQFGNDLEMDGTVKNADSVAAKLATALDSIVE